jgi:hypothetical protein
MNVDAFPVCMAYPLPYPKLALAVLGPLEPRRFVGIGSLPCHSLTYSAGASLRPRGMRRPARVFSCQDRSISETSRTNPER